MCVIFRWIDSRKRSSEADRQKFLRCECTFLGQGSGHLARVTLQERNGSVKRGLPVLVVVRDQRGDGSEKKTPEPAISSSHLVQGRDIHLLIVQGKQFFESWHCILCEQIFARRLPQLKRGLHSIFSQLEETWRLVAVAILLQKPSDVYRLHEFVEQMAVAVPCPARNEGKMQGE